MNSSIRNLSILLILSLSTNVFGDDLAMEPNLEELEIDEGDVLQITCTSDINEMQFYYPEDNDQTNTSQANIKSWKIDGKHHATLRRSEAVAGDTGYYGCSDINVQATRDVHNQTNVRWIYIYVRSKTSLFTVGNFGSGQSYGKVRGSMIFPCLPTSPNYPVIPELNWERLAFDDRLSFDPRVGFTLHNITLGDNGVFRCLIEIDGNKAEFFFFSTVEIIPNHLPTPRIDDRPLRYVTLGQTLRVNCGVEIKIDDFSYTLNWTIPDPSRQFKITSYMIPVSASLARVISELQIANIRNEDAGDYTCRLDTFDDHVSNTRTLKIHDSNNKFIHLIPQNLATNYILPEGINLTWVVDIDAYPPPEIISWIFIDENNKENEINSSQRHEIKISPEKTVLKIKKLKIFDTGRYVLRVINGDDPSYVNNARLDLFLKVSRN